MNICSGPGSAAHQAAMLREEGVRVDEDSMGEYYVDFGRYGWFPDRLPSEEGEELSLSSDVHEDGEGDRNGGRNGDLTREGEQEGQVNNT